MPIELEADVSVLTEDQDNDSEETDPQLAQRPGDLPGAERKNERTKDMTIKRNGYNWLIFAGTMVSFLITALMTHPLLSASSPGEQISGTIVIRGYNLIEFSALGIIPVIAPLIAALIVNIHCKKGLQEISLILLLCGNLICYAAAVNASRNWLWEVCEVRDCFHPALFSYPLLYIGLALYFFAICGKRCRKASVT